MKVIVFDLGGTLMQYVGMPSSWVDFYRQGVNEINQRYNCKMSNEVIGKTVQMLENFNPRINYRETEYSAEFIFAQILEHWHIDVPISKCIETFWFGLKLKAEIYSDVIPVLSILRERDYIIATLTDLPNAMPDNIFKRDISELLDYIDYYVSSAVSGYRKPNCKGLQMISEKYKVPITKLIFVGDEEKDSQTALNANCKFISIKRFEENEEGISDLYELLKII